MRVQVPLVVLSGSTPLPGTCAILRPMVYEVQARSVQGRDNGVWRERVTKYVVVDESGRQPRHVAYYIESEKEAQAIADRLNQQPV